MSSWGEGSGVNSLTRRLDVDFEGVAVAVLMFGSCSR
ncbi:hypothetical protein AHiyo4_41650 [Arthrobacter sp. Hiyo4]|nr:hypothetical protein AHiyo4_41650 [Arthrobacter sp. Hiyo4]